MDPYQAYEPEYYGHEEAEIGSDLPDNFYGDYETNCDGWGRVIVD